MQEKTSNFDELGHLNELGLSLYINALIEDNLDCLDHELLLHVEECRLCKSLIIENYRLFKNLDPDDNEVKESDYVQINNLMQRKKTNRTLFLNISRIAAAVAVLITLGYLATLILDKNNTKIEEYVQNEQTEKTNKSGENNQGNINNSTSIENKELNDKHLSNDKKNEDKTIVETSNLIAANFEESANLENFININVRSDGDFTIISPLQSKEFGPDENILFKWETDINQPLELVILTNKEEVTKKINVKFNHEYSLKEKLPRGLYYWKLETEDDLYHTGKFYIK